MTPHSETPIWRCPNCGQFYFGDDPPDMCAFCRDFTTWMRADVAQNGGHNTPTPHSKRHYGTHNNNTDNTQGD